MSDRPLALSHYGALNAVGLVPGQGQIDRALVARRSSDDDRPVDAVNLVSLELRGQLVMRGIRLGHDHQARGVLVQPVHDPGPQRSADACQIYAVRQQEIDQRAPAMARSRMHGDAGRLIDDDDRCVLVKDVQLRGLGRNGGVLRRRDGVDDLVARFRPAGRLSGTSIETHRTLQDQPARHLAGGYAVKLRQHLIQTAVRLPSHNVPP